MSGTALLLAAAVAHAVAADAWLVAHPADRPATAITDIVAPGSTVQAQPDRDNRMTISVRIGGRGPYRFVVDTGSQSTVVSTALAGDLGLVIGPPVRVMGMGGTEDVGTARLDLLEFGSHSLRDLTVPVLEANDMGADGIIGTDSLKDRRVVLDFTRNLIAIEDAPRPAARSGLSSGKAGGAANAGYEIVVRAKDRFGRLILTDATVDGVKTAVVIDTGATGSIGNSALQRAMRRRSDGRITLTSVTGQVVDADRGMASKLSIGKLYITNVMLAYTEAAVFAKLGLSDRPALFLGMRELRGFKRIALDFDRHKVLFDLPE